MRQTLLGVIRVSVLTILTACAPQKKEKYEPFPLITIADEEWATYEGKWLTKDGILRLELSIQQTSSVGVDSYYILLEAFESDSSANGTKSQGKCSIYYGLTDDEIGIRLRDLALYSKGVYFRVSESKYLNLSEEMFFVTRGSNELIPCDENFKPITTDRRYTLHKRLNHFTIEGYITFYQDSVEFFERNTREYWKVADLGEFGELKSTYKQLTNENNEGMYLKALAFSVSDTTSRKGNRALVVKRIQAVGKGPDE